MIRVDLGSGRQALGRRILVVVKIAALAVVAVGGAIWLEDRYALLESWGRPVVAQTDAPVSRDYGAPVVTGEQGEGVGSPKQRLRPNEGASPMPRQSDLCLRAVEQYRRLPTALLPFTSLNSEASGNYTFQGLRPVRELSDLFDFLHDLQRMDWRPTLSYWQEGGSLGERPYGFVFRGVVTGSTEGKPLGPLTLSEAQAMLDGVVRRARTNGLGQVTVTDSVGQRLTPIMVRLRPRLRATGTYRQINSFSSSLRQLTDKLTLAQLAILPIRDGVPRGKMELSAALEMLVRTSAQTSAAVAADADL
jgi:hypothetical protein